MTEKRSAKVANMGTVKAQKLSGNRIESNEGVPRNDHHVKGLLNSEGQVVGKADIPALRKARRDNWEAMKVRSGASPEELEVLDEVFERYTDPDTAVGPKAITGVRWKVELDSQGRQVLEDGKPKRVLDKKGRPIIQRMTVKS